MVADVTTRSVFCVDSAKLQEYSDSAKEIGVKISMKIIVLFQCMLSNGMVSLEELQSTNVVFLRILNR